MISQVLTKQNNSQQWVNEELRAGSQKGQEQNSKRSGAQRKRMGRCEPRGKAAGMESCCAQREQGRSRLLSQAVRRGKKKRWEREKGDGREVSWVRCREDCTTGAGGIQKYTLLELS